MNAMVPIVFDNTEVAFAYKSDRELKKAKFLFSTMRYPILVNTGIWLTPRILKISSFINRLVRQTIFQQFVGGETLEETKTVVDKLSKFKVQVILDYGVEGGEDAEADFDHSLQEFLKVIDYASNQPYIPFISIKVTGIARRGLLEKLDSSVAGSNGTLMKRYNEALESLTNAERTEWNKVQTRMENICRNASEKGISVLVDAEETWIQDPVDVLTILMMEKYNHSKAVVYNTVQLYRHDRMNFLRDALEAAEMRGFILGTKLVRGAYMETERKRAVLMKYPSPIQPDKAATDHDFNESVRFCIDHLNHIAFIVATHNEDSNIFTTQLLHKNNLPLDHPHVHFSQLYGMSDHITFNLAQAGCSVSKYLPFGPIKDVVPYLMRRAQENSSISGQTGKELLLIKKEIRRRKTRAS